ncbi:hypothetical protein [Nocardia sp. CY41]|uniref:hypothetical protein n=1 Tax=Nocardia sp. CY41 TaxID=2608686 RepID=UPI0013580E6E|nr:hypothetical protein [Nocardia sp. CY41]
MSETIFPAHFTVDESTDIDGLPMLTADVTVPPAVADLPLPPGPEGDPGPQGRARTTFLKMGAIANAGARPTGLGPDDRGKWWHRLDTNGMDVWDGTDWKPSPGAVGPQGPIAATNTITVDQTTHNENITAAAVQFSGSGAAQHLKVTVPAGPPGATGPAGASGVITTSPDYDATSGAANRSPFAWNSGARKFRAVNPPNGYGPWSWYETDFIANTGEINTSRIIAGQFIVPALPFEWRPICYGNMSAYIDNAPPSYFRATVRLFTTEGVVVAGYRSKIGPGAYQYVNMTPLYADDESTKTVSPTSHYATVPAGQPANLVVAVERLGTSVSASTRIGFNQTRASLVVYAQPV